MGSVDLVQKHLSSWRKLENRTICYIIRSSRQLHFVPPAAVKWEIMKLWNKAPLSLLSCFKVNLGQRGKGVWDEIPTSSYASFFLVFIFLSAQSSAVDAGVMWNPDVRLERGRRVCAPHQPCLLSGRMITCFPFWTLTHAGIVSKKTREETL